MIQRKQTLFLLGVILLAALLYIIPVFYFTDTKGVVSVISLNPLPHFLIINNFTYCYPVFLNMLIILLSIFIVFKFKNRNLQFKLANILALLNVFLIGLLFLLDFVRPPVTGSITYKYGLIIPILNAILAYLAAHFIKKDEQLVRNADRIR